ncbi:beta-propeller domain-containing protein [Colwellia sp. 4_MG-2023]|uniref:beta-propeller domain-containing protein n=1 Tax=unclassified Colwellia TaxID=196834 RepID=UPI001C0A5F77|nr:MULTISPECIES: beta-propeller domain-containing protein [unclassified Colwellia]MBU2925915.1 beta-propeller domain-containing protein [Colwellia sp. C2M11]MDO6507400.1 beta-propeller domain-containing protein [Colwellia sp. 5_MG-2023]MDO6556180.1 beta-propeller domain-containing protein [Colwellia sp. 4_MG-2023]MDO6652687.1 beta-propeller domain-containing protein [Colwellia sp. 3_MG-2023]MDO6665562.1 beta-propeller domain-containing protein [Colwellia sp. 2_MG-2023]
MLDKKLILLGYFFLLVGCGSDEKTEAPVEENIQVVPSLNDMSIALTPLKAANPTDFEHHLKNGVYLNSTQKTGFLEPINADTANATESISNEGGQQSNYSLTINQEAGVAEGDRLKYDGEYMYIANDDSYQQQGATQETSKTSIRIVQRNEEGGLREMSNTVVSKAASSINSLYLRENTLAVLSNIYDYSIANSMLTSTIAIDMFFPTEQNFNLSLLDVSNQAAPNITTSYTMDGSIIDSRRVDNVLYIVSSFSPYVSGLPYATTDAEKLENYQHVFASNISDFLPQLTDSEGNTSNLVEPENCYLPANSTDKDGFNGIVTLTTVDLTQPDSISSVCINTQVSGLYATPTSVYLYGTDYQYENNQTTETSIIHKFSIAKQDIDYVASGTLDGRFNWGLSNLRFSEKDNNLRVVTTKGNQSVGYEHRLNILSPSGNQLKLVAQLPNDTYPNKIGKVNNEGIVQEDIKAVRFFENKAFVVTFLDTDPLYVLDLSDTEQLKIAGALEIPGYSSYLHPISDNLLVGIGQNVDPNRMVFIDAIAIDSAESIPIIEGAKISLFDVSNMNNPLEINSIVYKDGYTPVEYNYHALTYLKMPNGTHRFGLPVEKWLTETVVNLETGNEIDIWTRDNALQLIEVTGDDTDALLVDKGSVNALMALEPTYISGWDDRAIFHGDDIYYLHGNNIWKSFWQTPELTTGPF